MAADDKKATAKTGGDAPVDDKKAPKKKTTTKKKKGTIKKGQTVANFKRHDGDTGSPEVQIFALTQEITALQDHVKTHKKDVDAKRSLLKKVAKRRTFLKYLKKTALERYAAVSQQLSLKV